MDNKIEILLNSQKNITSVNVDTYNKIELISNQKLINEYDVNRILNATELFDAEREVNENYRIYGKIEYMSILNGLKNSYSEFKDFFLPQIDNSKNITNSFDFYLVKPAESGYTQIVDYSTRYLRYFKVIATPADFEIYPIGFANNVYGEQAYSFNFNNDFNIADLTDGFGFPLTELFLYAQYKRTGSETMKCTLWNAITGNESKVVLNPTTLVIGDYVKVTTGGKISDMIEYSEPNYYQYQLYPQTFYIFTPYDPSKRLVWKYNPFIPFQLRYLSNDLYKANTGNTSYDEITSIPTYATNLGNDNFVWREILPQGYIDPLTGIGVNYPFINKKRYLFSNIVFSVVPDLTDSETLTAFSAVWFEINATTINTTPIGDINNIGKPCR